MAPNPTLLRALGVVGFVCSVAPIGTDVASWTMLAPDYQPMHQTISDLAAGPSSWLEDVGLLFFVASCLSVATGFWFLQVEGRGWRLAILTLVLQASAVGLIARVNEYAGTGTPGASVHALTTGAMAACFVLTTLLAHVGLRRLSGTLGRFSLWLGLAWVVLAGIYFVVPESWTGAWERMLAVMMLAWLAAMSRRLYRAGAAGSA